jgi:luciferase-like monooxygenase
MAVAGAQKRIIAAVQAWEQVEIRPHRYGGQEFRLGKRELGHIHGDALVDIPFPKAIRNEIVAAGEAEPHHILPDSGWISLFLRTDEDVDRAISLLQRSLELAREHRKSATAAR